MPSISHKMGRKTQPRATSRPSTTTVRFAPTAGTGSPATTASWFARNAAITSAAQITTDACYFVSAALRARSNSSPGTHSTGFDCPLASHPSTNPNRAILAFPPKSQSARYSSAGW